MCAKLKIIIELLVILIATSNVFSYYLDESKETADLPVIKQRSIEPDEKLIPVKFHRDFTLEDCYLDTQQPEDPCDFMKYVVSWYHGKCQVRRYGGCNPTRNNFESHLECMATAGLICDGIGDSIVERVLDLAVSYCPFCHYLGLTTDNQHAELQKHSTNKELRNVLKDLD